MSELNHLECVAGEAYSVVFTLDPVENIAAWTFTFTVKEYVADSTAVITKTLASGIAITTAASGIFTLSLTTSDTNITAKKYVYDLWRTNSGSEASLSHGNFDVKDRVRIIA